MSLPVIIQGGMGVAVSNWRLAHAVSQLGQLGVVSGTAIGLVLARRLQSGDPGGHMIRALKHFPIPGVVEDLIRHYFVPGGKPAEAPYKSVPMPGVEPSRSWLELTIAGSFAEVFLAREGHGNAVGINLLEKIQVATLATLYGAMLAGAGYVLMGAGIPREIPGVLDQFAAGEAAKIKIDVDGTSPGQNVSAQFDPQTFFAGGAPTVLERPKFLAIVSSATLAITLARKSNGRVDGFVIEGATAGGHNAPPRGPMQLNAAGEPVYGPRDEPELDKFRKLGLPFWLAGSFGGPEKLDEALEAGATGIQVGTAFAFCEESGIHPEIKRDVCRMARTGSAHVHTDPLASPTGFPFKILQRDGTMSESSVCELRQRRCDLGYLRQAYTREDGSLGYRCPAEPADDWVRKQGDPEALAGRKCVCNGLLATIGLGQVRSDGRAEPPLITVGDEVEHLARFLVDDSDTYRATDVVRILTNSNRV